KAAAHVARLEEARVGWGLRWQDLLLTNGGNGRGRHRAELLGQPLCRVGEDFTGNLPERRLAAACVLCRDPSRQQKTFSKATDGRIAKSRYLRTDRCLVSSSATAMFCHAPVDES